MGSINKDELIKRAAEQVEGFNLEELLNSGFIPRDGRCFVQMHYPPERFMAPIKEEEFFAGLDYKASDPFIVYAHIPFCINRCVFCHFYIKTHASPEDKDKYLDTMEKEMDLYLERLGLDRINTSAVNIGGGTPTDMSPAQLDRFLSFFTKRLDLSSCRQITWDVDLTTLLGAEGMERLKLMRRYGANRIAIGIQSFNDFILKKMNRAHNGGDGMEAVKQARKAGFDNICFDMIYGYPFQTMDEWITELETALTLEPDSMQLYRIRVTPTGSWSNYIEKWWKKRQNDFPSYQETMLMKRIGYLVSEMNGYSDRNYTGLYTKKKEGISVYNKAHTAEFFDTIGLGPSSRVLLKGRIGMNVLGGIEAYTSAINQGKLAIEKGHIVTDEENIVRRLAAPLKFMREVDKEHYRKMTGVSLDTVFPKKIKMMKDYDLLTEDDEKLMLTSRGHFFADEVCIHFYHRKYMPFPRSAYAQGEFNPYIDLDS